MKLNKKQRRHVKLVREAGCGHPAIYYDQDTGKVFSTGWCKLCREKYVSLEINDWP